MFCCCCFQNRSNKITAGTSDRLLILFPVFAYLIRQVTGNYLLTETLTVCKVFRTRTRTRTLVVINPVELETEIHKTLVLCPGANMCMEWIVEMYSYINKYRDSSDTVPRKRLSIVVR